MISKLIMSQILEAPKQVLRKASEILRNTKCVQYFGGLRNSDNTRFCALGVILHDGYGWSGDERDLNDMDIDKFAASLGLDGITQRHIVRMNDTFHYDFNRIADWLEREGL
jgi:hypothetical protein